LTPEGWPIITRAFFTGRSNYKPDIEEIEVQVGDMILICSDGVYGNGKWDILIDTMMGDGFDIDDIYSIAVNRCNDNISAILIRLYDV
jgi:serine/threonine protein phosphatase PrpC